MAEFILGFVIGAILLLIILAVACKEVGDMYKKQCPTRYEELSREMNRFRSWVENS